MFLLALSLFFDELVTSSACIISFSGTSSVPSEISSIVTAEITPPAAAPTPAAAIGIGARTPEKITAATSATQAATSVAKKRKIFTKKKKKKNVDFCEKKHYLKTRRKTFLARSLCC